MNNDAPLPDYDQANRFFDALTGSKDEAITFQFYTENKELKAAIPEGEKDPRASHTHKQRPIDFAFADKKQANGCGVWAMVNAGDGKGRKGKNVVKVRALFVDLDGAPWEPAAKALRPHMRVESSPGRWHLYWLVDDCALSEFKPLQQAIARKFNGDKSCCDLPRVLRVPGFFHLKNDPVLTRLAEVNDFPRYSTQQVIDGLGLELAPAGKMPTRKPKENQAGPPPASSPAYTYTNQKTGEIIDLTAWAAQNPGFDIVKAVNDKYAMGPVSECKQHIVCPFADDHTDTSSDLATFIANADGDYASFDIHCMHSHCADRDRLEFLQAMLEKGWLPAVELIPATLPAKRVPKIYYPANEIASELQLRTLTPNEFRILLHLMHLSWAAEDGTIPDDDWMIARSLGLEESDWLQYRTTLIRTGWLEVVGNRLTNDIFRREFAKAQYAYDSYRRRGQKGGKSNAKAEFEQGLSSS